MSKNPINPLASIEYGLQNFSPNDLEKSVINVWLMYAAMQKAIRRGEEHIALQAAFTLWHTDRNRFWRRLHIIALEDIGVAGTEALTATLAATSAPYWRRRMGDMWVGLYLVRLLCRSPKTRLVESLFTQAECDPAYAPQRTAFATSTDDELVSHVTDITKPLVERALALWYLAGTKKYPSDKLTTRIGNPALAAQTLEQLSAPTSLTKACIGVMNRSPWPLAIMTPLVWQHLQMQKATRVESRTIPQTLTVKGIPLYALDMFTRSGQACFRLWRKTIPPLHRYNVRQIGMAVFYVEGHLLDRYVVNPAIAAFMQRGEVLDANKVGLSLEEYTALLEVVREHMDTLQHIRMEHLQSHDCSQL